MLILTKLIRFSITSTWDVLNVNANRMKSLLRNAQKCLNHVFLLEQLKNYLRGKTSHKTVAWSNDMEDMQKSALNDTASWQTKRFSNCTKFQVLAWMITNSRRMSWNLLVNY